MSKTRTMSPSPHHTTNVVCPRTITDIFICRDSRYRGGKKGEKRGRELGFNNYKLQYLPSTARQVTQEWHTSGAILVKGNCILLLSLALPFFLSLFPLTLHIQSIRKFRWLYLQTIFRISQLLTLWVVTIWPKAIIASCLNY